LPRRHSSCASQVQPRRHKVERTGLCFRCACRANQPPIIIKSLASLGILWSSTDGSCHQGTIKRGCIRRARTATEREDLPQASPPFALRREHSNGATCGSFARRNPGRAKQRREGRRSSLARTCQWMTLKHKSLTVPRVAARPRGSTPRIVCFLHHVCTPK